MTDRNANRPGYKKTGVGWIPKNWRIVPLATVAQVRTGVAKGRTEFRKPVRMPYLRVANVQDGHVQLDEVKEITVEAEEVGRYSLRRGDVLFTEGGDFDKLGRGCVWSGAIRPCLHQNHVFAVRCKPTKLLPYFLASVASSPVGRRYFALSSKQSTNLASINSTQLNAFSVPLPLLLEQRAISGILSAWDTAIAQSRVLLNAARRRKKGLAQQLLTGKRRLPGFGGEWRRELLSSVAERIEDSPFATSGYPVLSITAGTGFVSQEEKFSKVIAGRHIENYVLLKRGEFAYNKGNSTRYPQGCACRLREYDAGLVPDVFYSFRTKPRSVVAEFVEQFFMAGLHGVQLRGWVNTGVRNNGLLNLNATDFFNLRVPCPPLKEQRAIAAVLGVADDEIRLLEAKCAALERQKRGLMQKLLTGEVRVGQRSAARRRRRRKT